MEALLPYVFVFAGAFSIAGAVMDWDCFMNNDRTRLFVKLLGRNGARGFYVALGLGIGAFGLLQVLGLVRV